MQNKNLLLRNTEKNNKGCCTLDIRKKVSSLRKKYKTNNPFDIAKSLGITILFEELGGINGYYNKQLRMKQIHINCNLPRHEQSFTCAHELGHALPHPNANTPFLRKKTYLSVEKLEMEANKFAIELLISDEDLLEYKNYTTEQVSHIFGYHKGLIDLRLR